MDSFLYFYAREGTTDCILNQFRNRLRELQDVDSVRDKENNTLLHAAVSCSNVSTVSLLLERGADPFAVNKQYDMPLSLAKAASEKADCTPEESEVFRIIKYSVDQRGNSAKEDSQSERNSQGESSEAIDFPCGDSEIRPLSTSNCPEIEHQVTEEECDSKEGITRKAEVRNKREECQEKPSQTINKVTEAQKCWDIGDYEGLLTLLKNDFHFPVDFSPKNIHDDKSGAEELRKFVERRKQLHSYIESGNLSKVEEATKFSKSFLYLNIKNESALYRAAKKKQLEIFAYFKFINLRYKDDNEKRPEKDCEKMFSEKESEAVNRFLDDYSEERGNFHVLKLVTSTRVLGKFTEELEKITDELYNYLDKSDCVSLLMKVLKYENIQATFDFERKNIERVYQGYRQGSRGISETFKRKMFIGAKGCAPQDMDGSFKIVAGTVAHELCHLAVDVLYKNDAKPYKKEEIDKMREFGAMAIEIQEALSSCEIHDVIARVFGYPESHWHAELIVRVPHMLALLGESRGKKELNAPVLRKLYDYYEKNIVPHCKMYSEGKNFKHDLVRMKDLKDLGTFVEEMETANCMTKVSFDQLTKKLISYNNLSILVTSSVYLSSSLIYYHLKSIYYFHFDKRCLFIKLNAFIKDFSIILNAYKFSACDYLVLSANDASVDFLHISGYFSEISFSDKKKKSILVVRSDCVDLKPEWRNEIQYHHWKDLTDSSRKFILKKEVIFQGVKMKFDDLVAQLEGDENLESSVLQAEELSYLIDKKYISIGNADHQKFPGNSDEYYMERRFARESLKDTIYIMVRGPSLLSMNKVMEEINEIEKEIHKIMEEMRIPISTMLRLDIDNCVLIGGKFTLLKLRHMQAGFVFKRISQNMSDNAYIFCYNFKDGEYYTTMSDSNTRKMVDFCKSETISEGELISFSDSVQDRVVVISDEPGAGKSTVIAGIIGKLKEKGFWIERIDLNDFADGDKNPVGLTNLKSIEKSEEVINFFMKMAGLRNCLERTFFKLFLHRPLKTKLFFDGFDEISPSYKDCVMKLLRVLINETKVQIWITTRKHEREYLEDNINTFSYKLEQLSLENQSILIGKIWKHKMKSSDEQQIENGESYDKAVYFRIGKKIRDVVEQLENDLSKEGQKDLLKETDVQKEKDSQAAKLKLKDELQNLISFINKNRNVKNFSRVVKTLKKKVDEMNLDSYAAVLLRNMPDSIVDKNNLFTGVPLLLYMVAVLAYDKNLEFNVYSDTYTLYMDVIRGKMEIYLRGKGKSVQKTQSNLTKEEMLEMKICELHETFASKVIQAKNWDAAELKETDKRLMLEFGVVVQLRNKFSFVHRTFADFFYCKWMLSKFIIGEIIEKELEEMLKEPQYTTVRHFLNDKYQSSKVEEFFGIPEKLVEKINVNNIFLFCVSNEKIEDCVNVWQDVVVKYEQVSDYKSFMYFLNSISSSVVKSVHVLLVLSGSLSDDSLIAFFDSIVHNVWQCSVEAIGVFLRMLKRTICLKAYKRSREHTLGTSLLGKTDEQVDNKFEEIKSPHGISETISLLERRGSGGDTLLLKASRNEYTVFSKVLKFFEKILGKDLLEKHMTARNSDGLTVLHYCSIFGSHSVECDSTLDTLIEAEQFSKENAYTALLKEKDNLGCNFLHYFVWKTVPVVMKEALERLDRWSRDVLVGLVVAKNKEGLNVLHPACNNSDLEVLKEILLWGKRVMSDEQFLEFVKSQDNSGNTIFHTRAKFVRTHPGFGSSVNEHKTVRELNVLKEFLDDRSLLELMTRVNVKKETFLHTSADGHLSLKNFIYATEVLDPKSLEELLSKVDSEGYTFLHKLARQKDSVDIVHALRILKDILLEPSLTRLLEIRSRGQNVLGTVSFHKRNLHKVILSFFPPKCAAAKD